MDHTSFLSRKISDSEGITFDDLLLLPRYADFKRNEVSLSTKLHDRIVLKLPIIASPMDTVCEKDMAIAMAREGGLGIIHRNLSIKTQMQMVEKVKSYTVLDLKESAVDGQGRLLVGGAIGVGADAHDRIDSLYKAQADCIVIDSGHGHSRPVIDMVLYVKKKYPLLPLMAGNIATREGARALVEAGCDILRVGMGPGSICTTRIVTGMGVPQLTAISNAVEAVKGSKVTVVADGGVRQIGDMAKALACGAHAVMLGSLLARYDESAGDTVTLNNKKYKRYRGMGSVEAMRKGGAERYGQSSSDAKKDMIAEGIDGFVAYEGSVNEYLRQIAGSLRSSLYYVGSKTLSAFFMNARFIKISRAGLIESHPHSITIRDAGKNYTV